MQVVTFLGIEAKGGQILQESACDCVVMVEKDVFIIYKVVHVGDFRKKIVPLPPNLYSVLTFANFSLEFRVPTDIFLNIF